MPLLVQSTASLQRFALVVTRLASSLSGRWPAILLAAIIYDTFQATKFQRVPPQSGPAKLPSSHGGNTGSDRVGSAKMSSRFQSRPHFRKSIDLTRLSCAVRRPRQAIVGAFLIAMLGYGQQIPNSDFLCDRSATHTLSEDFGSSGSFSFGYLRRMPINSLPG